MTDRELARLRYGMRVLDVPEFLNSLKLARDVTALVPNVAGLFAGWADQVYRAAVSIPANIAEGYGRSTLAQQQQFHSHARGSAFEVLALLLAPPPGVEVAGLVKLVREVVGHIDARMLEVAEQQLTP